MNSSSKPGSKRYTNSRPPCPNNQPVHRAFAKKASAGCIAPSQSKLACEGCYTKAVILSKTREIVKELCGIFNIEPIGDRFLEQLEMIRDHLKKVVLGKSHDLKRASAKITRCSSSISFEQKWARPRTPPKKATCVTAFPSPIKEYEEDCSDKSESTSNVSTSGSNGKLSTTVDYILRDYHDAVLLLRNYMIRKTAKEKTKTPLARPVEPKKNSMRKVNSLAKLLKISK